jgi:hypothetical protein
MVFRKSELPDFSRRELEVRLLEGEVAVYGTREGLQQLAGLMLRLAEERPPSHLHVEDYELLTDCSPRLTLAVFEASER